MKLTKSQRLSQLSATVAEVAINASDASHIVQSVKQQASGG